jgi:hypothetical protein
MMTNIMFAIITSLQNIVINDTIVEKDINFGISMFVCLS